MNNFPVYDQDLYSDEAILNPYGIYKEMRDLGPVVYLQKHNVLAVTRYAEVKKAALDHKSFISGRGVAAFDWPEEILGDGTIVSDEPLHSKLRGVIGGPLSPSSLVALTEQIETAADSLIARLLEMGSFDGMADLARFLPVSIVKTLVGLPEEGRERMLDWAAASFNVTGADNDRAKAAWPLMFEMVEYVTTKCTPETVTPGGFAANIWKAVAEGKITPRQASLMHIDVTAPALDTTILATGHLIHQLGSNPEQWAILKKDPSLIPAAIDEAIRVGSPARGFGRVAKGDAFIGDARVPDGQRVLLLYASGNHDERRWVEPTRYNIQREGVSGHLGFGQGHHTCVGAHLAKLEMRSLLKAIIKRVDKIEVSEPTYILNNNLRGFESLPVRFAA